MNIEQMETAYNRIIGTIKKEFEAITKEFNITGLNLLFLDNIKYRVRFNKDIPVDAYDLRVSTINDDGMAKIEWAELVVLTDKIKEYIKHNEGMTIKLQAKFKFVLRFEVGHYLYFKDFEDSSASYDTFRRAIDNYEAELAVFNKLWSETELTTRERILKYYEIDFNAWSANKVGLDAETLIEFDNNIRIP
jgi:hypothetical protein